MSEAYDIPLSLILGEYYWTSVAYGNGNAVYVIRNDATRLRFPDAFEGTREYYVRCVVRN